MQINASNPTDILSNQRLANAENQASQLNGTEKDGEVREVFNQFVGETFFGMMIKSMRATTDKPAYFHGGRAEEVFQSQLDQQMSQELAESSASEFSDPMFELFNMRRP